MENAGAGGGPAPFLIKTYEMVDDSSTDNIVSWSSGNKSFVVWNPPEFERILLPMFFKHNNFASFIRQLNTYGFRKIYPERWEFANEEFIKDQKHLLKNIYRRKPIHSHSHTTSVSTEAEKTLLEEKIETISLEKANLEQNISDMEQQRLRTMKFIDQVSKRVTNIEQRQQALLSFLEKAAMEPEFVRRLYEKLESTDVSAYNKKRRTPQTEELVPMGENNEHSFKPEFGNVIPDFCDKLRLEVSPASDAQSSNEDFEMEEGNTRTPFVLLAPETLELSDTGASCEFKLGKLSDEEQDLNLCRDLNEAEGLSSCQLNLSLSSCLLINRNPHQDVNTEKQMVDQKDCLAPVRANDKFWEQYLTERPGSSD